MVRGAPLPPYAGPMAGPGSFNGATTRGASLPLMQGNSSAAMEQLEGLATEPVKTLQRIFATDRYFIRTYRNRWFLPLGIGLNILAAIIIGLMGPLATSLMVAVIGAVVAIFCLYRCAISVKKPVAAFFASVVAIWWGYVIASIASAFSFATPDAPLLFFFFGFAISLGIHIWYIQNRLKS